MDKSGSENPFYLFDREREEHPWQKAIEVSAQDTAIGAAQVTANWRMDHRVSDARETAMLDSDIFLEDGSTGSLISASKRYFRQHLCRPQHENPAYLASFNAKNRISEQQLSPVLKAQGDLDGAKARYEENIAQWPNNEVSANGLAEVLKVQGDLDGAKARYEENIAQWPNNRVAKNSLANVLRVQQKDLGEALGLLPDPSDAKPIMQWAYDLHLRGMILLDLGREDEAREMMEKGINLFPSGTSYHYFRRGLMLIEMRLKQYEKAEEILKSEESTNVIRLDLYRLHIAAGKQDQQKAQIIFEGLQEKAQSKTLDFHAKETLQVLDDGFGLSGAKISTPNETQVIQIFNAELEMERASGFALAA